VPKGSPAAPPEPEPAPAPVAPPAPAREKPDGATSQADPPVKQPAPVQGGFPEDLEPSVVLPIPVAPPAGAADPADPDTGRDPRRAQQLHHSRARRAKKTGAASAAPVFFGLQ
jgi:hypothetical protein